MNNSSALLDVNVLIALLDPDHPSTNDAHAWFVAHGGAWATCPLTIHGCVRVLSNASYSPRAFTPSFVMGVLRDFCSHPRHEFWPDSLSLLDEAIFHPSAIAGSARITDTYLLGLAVQRNRTLVTFDRSISLKSVAGAGARHLEILGAKSLST